MSDFQATEELRCAVQDCGQYSEMPGYGAARGKCMITAQETNWQSPCWPAIDSLRERAEKAEAERDRYRHELGLLKAQTLRIAPLDNRRAGYPWAVHNQSRNPPTLEVFKTYDEALAAAEGVWKWLTGK